MALIMLLCPRLLEAREDNAVNRLFCLAQFALFDFQIFEFDRYGEYFNDDTVLELAQTGSYIGAEAIEEYVRFGSDSSSYILENLELDQFNEVKTASDPLTGECVLNVVASVSYIFNKTITKERVHSVPAMLKIYYDPGSHLSFGKEVEISRVNIYYDAQFLEGLFGDVLITDPMQEFICQTLYDCGEEEWALQGFDSVLDCQYALSALPPTGPGGIGDVTGNNQGCRALHAQLAQASPKKHCPHISFVPFADPDGLIKCQNQGTVQVSDLFDEGDLAFFNKRVAQLGFDVNAAFHICNCDEDGGWGDDAFVALWNGFWDIVPLVPQTWPVGKLPMCTLCGRDKLAINSISEVAEVEETL